MATKKKVLLEQETPVPENTAPADGTISSAGPPADAAAPPDSDDLSALLASMDRSVPGATGRREGCSMTQWEKMMAGEMYDAADPELAELRRRAKELCHQLNHTLDGGGAPIPPPGAFGPLWRRPLGGAGLPLRLRLQHPGGPPVLRQPQLCVSGCLPH